jgi:hypothetical protein
MFKAMIAMMALAFSANVYAATPDATDILVTQVRQAIVAEVHTMGLDWKVGDTNNYTVDIGGFIKGTMDMDVKSIGADGMWIDQNMDLGFAGKQQVQLLIDQNTGATKKMIVNGKDQEVPKQDITVIEVKEDHITVPAGEFDCVHARLQDNTNKQEINMWINPQLIPMSGMLKTLQPSQMGQVTILLKAFKKGN